MSAPRALAERRLSVLQFQADLRELVKAWGTPGRLGAELGFSVASVKNQMMGYQPATAPMCEKLYGPGHGNRIIVRGPDGRPVERRWVGDPAFEPVRAVPEPDEDEADEADELDAGVARIAAIVGKRGPEIIAPASETEPASQLPSTPQAPAEKAPAAETAQAAGPDAAGLDTTTAAGDGAAADSEQETAGPAGGEESVLPSSEAPPFGPPAAEPGAAPPFQEERAGDQEAGEAQDAPVSDLDAFDWPAPVRVRVGRVVPLPESEVVPWAGIPDDQLVTILRGKAAGLAAEMAGLEAEYSAGVRALEALSGRIRVLEKRRGQLLVTIDHFETEGAPGIRGQGENANG